MQRLIIHIGWTKCGSTTIQNALLASQDALKAHGIFLMTETLGHNRDRDARAIPLRALSAIRRSNEQQKGQLTKKVTALHADLGDADLVVSSETMSKGGMAHLLHGADAAANVTVIAYIRPQYDWLPSAWKQWGIKDGVPLSQYIDICLSKGRPAYLQVLREWRSALPNADIRVRFLHRGMMHGGELVEDFASVLWPGRNIALKASKHQANPSFDYSILAVMAKNPALLDGKGSRLFRELDRVLPDQFRSTNLPLIGQQTMSRIARHFEAENKTLLREFVRGTSEQIDEIYRSVFSERHVDRSLEELSDSDLIWRFLGVMLQTVASKSRN